MSTIYEGKLDGEGIKIAIVVSRFNHFITDKLLEGCIDCLIRHKVSPNDIHIYKVPGSFEIPPLTMRLALSGKYNGIICLGAIIRGATPHFDYIAAEVTKGIAQISLKTSVPIGFGILTTDNIEQAIERAGTKSGNKGETAAMAVIEMINLLKQI